jgi:hypothetical protein
MRSKFYLVIFITLASFHLQAQIPEYTHQVVRSFRVNNGLTLDLANKYGKVQVITWENDSVKFIIDLRIRAKDQGKLQKLKQSIDFEFTPGQSFLIARTKIGEAGSDVFKDIVDIAGNYLSGSSSVTINYTVMVPAYIQLKIENKFGDVYLDDLNQNLSLTLSYGDFTCNRLNASGEIRLTSGNAEVGYIREGQLFISYGNLHIHDADKLTAETRSSTITIDKTTSLQVNSRRDKLYLNDIGSLSGEGYFTLVNGGSLHNDVNFICRYGGFNLNYIRKSFTVIHLTAEYTKVSLDFEKPVLFNLELTHQQDIVFVYPRNLAALKTRVVNADSKQFLTSGTIGSGMAEAGVVINAPRKCNLTITYK